MLSFLGTLLKIKKLNRLYKIYKVLQSHFDINVRQGEFEIAKKILQNSDVCCAFMSEVYMGGVNVRIKSRFSRTLFLKYQKENQVNPISREQRCLQQQARY